MPLDLKDVFVVGISSRALFDLEAENAVFSANGPEEYERYQLSREADLLNPGAAFPLVKSLLSLNGDGKHRVEVILMSRNSANTSLRIWRSLKQHDLSVTRGVFTSGTSLATYLAALNVDLFLTAEPKDVEATASAGFAAGLMYRAPSNGAANDATQLRVAFDFDAVLASEEAELVNEARGLNEFHAHESENAKKPLPEGPLTPVAKKLGAFQREFPSDRQPIRTALVTARNAPSIERAVLTLRHWGVRIDETFFLGGLPKDKVLAAFRPHIFFDDHPAHCERAADQVPTAQVARPGGLSKGTAVGKR